MLPIIITHGHPHNNIYSNVNIQDYLKDSSPLHCAACNNDAEAIANIIASCDKDAGRQWLDSHGYTAAELAHLLGRHTLAIILGMPAKEAIKVVTSNRHTLQRYDPLRLLATLGFAYTPTLRFSSPEQWLELLKLAPYSWRRGSLGNTLIIRGESYRSLIMEGWIANLTVVWINKHIGYGVINNRQLASGDYIGTYTGEIRQIARLFPQLNAYCVHYPTRWWSQHYYVIDAHLYGNELRYVNHSNTPNVQAAWAYDRGLLHLIFFAKEGIPRGSHLTIDYGSDFWQHRSNALPIPPDHSLHHPPL
jgi:hypothetical protein